MEYFKIKSEKQNNGLWGIPMNIVELRRLEYMDEENELKFSAILTALGEKYSDAYISIKSDMDNDNTVLWVIINYRRYELKDTNYIIKMSDYGLIGDVLYYMSSDEDRKMYNRIRKLNKLKK